jgi:adenosylhomocysteine nucleosidase
MRRVCSLVLFVVLANAIPAFPQTPDGEARPIVVQGAMQIEVEKLVGRLENATLEQIGGWNFWRGTVNGYPVIVSKTLKGIANAAAATVLAIERYHPIAIVNQGTAGGLDPELGQPWCVQDAVSRARRRQQHARLGPAQSDGRGRQRRQR